MIHEMSSEHEEYDHDKTESTARSFGGPRTCDWFASNFGEHCEGYLRFSYANSLENIREGMNRLERYLKEQQR